MILSIEECWRYFIKGVIEICQTLLSRNFDFLEFCFKSRTNPNAFRTDFTPFFSNFDMSKFRLSRSNCSVPKVKINTNHVRYVELIINLNKQMSKCQIYGFRHSSSRVSFINFVNCYFNFKWSNQVIAN